MGLLDRFRQGSGRVEKGIEHVFTSAFNKAFASELQPVDIFAQVRRAMDDNAATMSENRVISPNEFVVYLSTDDFERLQEWGMEVLAEETAKIATEHATEQQYVFTGPVVVEFKPDAQLNLGGLRVGSSTKRGAVAPMTTDDSANRPLLMVGNKRYILTGAVTIIGRGAEANVVVDDQGVSRQHLELRVTPGGVIATDLNSTNGTFVEGHRISVATLVDGNTITIGRTALMFWAATTEPPGVAGI